MILGLDVSTATIGYTIIDDSGALIEMSYIPLSKTKGLTKKGFEFRRQLRIILQRNPSVDKVFIEECFQRFARGMSSARTITLLAAFNGITQYICEDELGITPALISVSACRSLVGIKTVSKKKAGKDVKEQVFEWVSAHLEYNWPTKILQSGPRKGQKIIINEARDMADAWVVAKAGLVKLAN
jgi:Holliday junction resolvasome RuvABC endonuclease subunit